MGFPLSFFGGPLVPLCMQAHMLFYNTLLEGPGRRILGEATGAAWLALFSSSFLALPSAHLASVLRLAVICCWRGEARRGEAPSARRPCLRHTCTPTSTYLGT
jgi:hypothetical protein